MRTVGSLFAGIGGFDLGFERAGFAITWQVEIDPFCQRVLAKYWPYVDRYADVRRVHSEERCHGCDDCLQPVDVIVGGDPCHFLRIVDEIRPRVVVRENPATVRADAPWPWWRFRMELERLGYVVLPFRLRACCVGADHRRDRLLLLATLPDADGSGLERAERKNVEAADGRRYDTDAGGPDRWSATPEVCRGPDGISDRVDRLRSLGNAIVPQIAEWIARRIQEADTLR